MFAQMQYRSYSIAGMDIAGDNMQEDFDSLKSDMTKGLMAHWHQIKGHKPMASRLDFNPAEVEPQILPHIILFDVFYEPLDFRYRVVGTKVVRYSSRDYTGENLSDIEHQREGSHLWKMLKQTVLEQKPMVACSPYAGPQKDFMASEDVLMPLTDEQGKVRYILAAVDFLSR
ncbi:PAS domain-containing protein [Kordiimonas sp. SCSIO 12610]|uniref:PAS domain-containing protein n=1 Tax=Kordiimonas sp. SCSIO 12610 TaxID=2829597 RepID=UPI00210E69BA|nr:PAS domain-containing protein [Kordiimonas sp. SCSIO 12610]UTW55997.1 PAS domain-containing protein [Kordiimonas sp. SCSIO 12610]